MILFPYSSLPSRHNPFAKWSTKSFKHPLSASDKLFAQQFLQEYKHHRGIVGWRVLFLGQITKENIIALAQQKPLSAVATTLCHMSVKYALSYKEGQSLKNKALEEGNLSELQRAVYLGVQVSFEEFHNAVCHNGEYRAKIASFLMTHYYYSPKDLTRFLIEFLNDDMEPMEDSSSITSSEEVASSASSQESVLTIGKSTLPKIKTRACVHLLGLMEQKLFFLDCRLIEKLVHVCVEKGSHTFLAKVLRHASMEQLHRLTLAYPSHPEIMAAEKKLSQKMQSSEAKKYLRCLLDFG
jgi:hypothetical protein